MEGNWASASSSRLFDLVSRKAWVNVKHRIESNPDEARYVDFVHGTALHRACAFGAPVDVVAPLLTAFPDAASEQNRGGRTPLHEACGCGCYSEDQAAVVRLLVSACPGASSVQSVSGLTPLHALCLNRLSSADAIHALLEAYPDATSVSCSDGCTPLEALVNEEIPDDEQISFIVDSCGSHSTWDKVSLLIEAAYRGYVSIASSCCNTENLGPDEKSLRVVHACFGVDRCPSVVLRLALELCPEQLAEADEDGNLPLHLAAASSAANEAWCDAAAASKLEQKEENHKKETTLETVLRLYPEGVNISNGEGKYPLQIALERGNTWGDDNRIVEVLFSASIASLANVGDMDRYLLILESLAKEDPPSTLFELMKAMPFVMKHR